MLRGRPLVLALAMAAAVVGGGCEYLLGYPTDPDWDEFADPSPLALFPSGSGTITIGDDPVITLDQVRSAGRLDAMFGGEVTISNGDGWYLRVAGASTSSSMWGSTAYLTIDRVADGEHWTTADPSRCIVTIEQADERGLAGSATCKGLRWSDALGAMMTYESDYIEGQEPFDAEITFEATPRTGSIG